MCAFKQLLQGYCLLHLTLRRRQVTQERALSMMPLLEDVAPVLGVWEGPPALLLALPGLSRARSGLTESPLRMSLIASIAGRWAAAQAWARAMLVS